MTQPIENPAVVAAKEAEQQVNACLASGSSFRLEAGAGAGKTFSLVAALKRLIKERGAELLLKGQKIACITYTEVGRSEIAQEIEEHPAILVATIHAFSWAFLRQFQKPLRSLVAEMEDRQQKIEQGGGIGSKIVEYDLGFFGVNDEKITLSHDDIPRFMAKLLSHEKFRQLLKQQFPIVFIDEYQDTDSQFMEAIKENFLKTGDGPLIGLFGDHWQTIYRSEYELADYPIKGIDKGSNFRSAPQIVNVLNKLRPELVQAVHNMDATGEARFFHANSYDGERTNDNNSKGDVLPSVARIIRENLMHRLKEDGWNLKKTKVLMLTHNVLASEQGYSKIADVFGGRNDLFARKEDPVIKFFAETVEPMYSAYADSRYGDMFRAFGSGPAILTHADKFSWRSDMDRLQHLRTNGTIGQVIDHLRKTKRPSPPDRVLKRDNELAALNGEAIPAENGALIRHSRLRDISYSEVIELVKFVEGLTPFATQHSVKGAEFENVLVVLGGGWNHYNWPKLFELLETLGLDKKNTKGYYRARNLFYVAISRPMIRLAVLATQTMSDTALATAVRLFGEDNVEGLDFP